MVKLFDRRNPPRLDAATRPGVLTAAGIRALSPAPRGARREEAAVGEGLALLWHDHWDAAHVVAQSSEGARDHDFLHAIAHRREGDFANAAYWFRGAGAHPCFDRIASRAEPLLAGSPALLSRLLPDGKWNPQAFLKAVEKSVKGSAGAEDENLLRAIQAEEIVAFYEWLMEKR